MINGIELTAVVARTMSCIHCAFFHMLLTMDGKERQYGLSLVPCNVEQRRVAVAMVVAMAVALVLAPGKISATAPSPIPDIARPINAFCRAELSRCIQR